jgi:glutamine synthetase
MNFGCAVPHSLPLKGDVFSEDLIEIFIDYKTSDGDAIQLRPQPYEFALYKDI